MNYYRPRSISERVPFGLQRSCGFFFFISFVFFFFFFVLLAALSDQKNSGALNESRGWPDIA